MIITFTVGGRAAYLRATLGTWRSARGIDQSEVFFNIEHDAMPAVEGLCRSFPAGHRYVCENTPRAGVLRAPWLAMERAFDAGHKFAVLAEEDVPVSADIIEYFTWASEAYLHDPDVRIVCAFNAAHPQGAEHEVLRTKAFSPLVWGTWADTWKDELRDFWDFDYSHRGWDYRICDRLRTDNRFIIQPARSRSQHIGEEGGAHCTAEMFPETISMSWTQYREPGSYYELTPPHLRPRT